MKKREAETEFEQTVFDHGDLFTPAREEATGDVEARETIVPGAETGFALEIRDGALEVNDALVKVREEHGNVVSFKSRNFAEAWADQISEEGGDLRVQAAAPQDERDIDAYLLAEHDPSVREPAKIDGNTLTFDVGANLHGALGETVVKFAPRQPALACFIENDLEINPSALEEQLRVRVTTAPGVSVDEVSGTWYPDCVAEARDGWNGQVLERYWCEIKTGNASFERSQIDVMESFARDERVLKIRVNIDHLPKQYDIKIHEVEPPNE